MQKRKKQVLGLSGLVFVAATTLIAHTLPPVETYAADFHTKIQAQIVTAASTTEIIQPKSNEPINPADLNVEVRYTGFRKATYTLRKKGTTVNLPLPKSEFELAPGATTPNANDNFKIPDLPDGEYVLTIDIIDSDGHPYQEVVEFKVDSSVPPKNSGHSGGSSSSNGSNSSNSSNDKNTDPTDKYPKYPYDPSDPNNPNPNDPYNPYDPFAKNHEFDPKNPKNPANPDGTNYDAKAIDPKSGKHDAVPESDGTKIKFDKETGNPIMSVSFKSRVCLLKVQSYTLPGMDAIFNPPVAFKTEKVSGNHGNFMLDFVSHGAKSGKYKIVTATFLKDKEGKCTILNPLPSVFELNYKAKTLNVPNTGIFSVIDNNFGRASYLIAAIIASFIALLLIVARKRSAKH